ncbi:sugar O-acetyltransferase [Listeria costaricensis]|uniref:sugar O-acetyltransferase n=1 Tax=Listeria costaricensis TaxID=2026604 RepID=UPI000C069ED2|nr:sugar O-acetyltransferase [Listeria costaricensis]
MTLNEKFAFMATGQTYNDLAPELTKAREDGIAFTNRYNASFGAPQKEREAILQTSLGSVGENVHFEPNFRCEFGQNIHIGNHFYANYDCIMLDGATIEIGDYVLFGPRAGIYTSNHSIWPEEREKGGCIAKPVKIGSRVWLGANVIVNPGVTIGENTIIGSGSVVTKSIPAGVIAAGNPCRVIRPITESDRTDYFENGHLK